ncbi:MAG: 5-formyltetrahydrofolate cyclo-ligase [Bacteroidota bacterium]
MFARKDAFRSELLKMRENLDPTVAEQLSQAIFSNIKNLEAFRGATVIHTYVSSKKNEVDTRQLVTDALKSGKRIVVPIVNLDHQSLDHSEILTLDELKPGTFGMLEPTMRRSIDLSLVEIVLVPVVGVDRRGNRIGLGKGYYDRFLRLIRKPKLALAYTFQVVDAIPPDQDGERVDFVVTEGEVIRCT